MNLLLMEFEEFSVFKLFVTFRRVNLRAHMNLIVNFISHVYLFLMQCYVISILKLFVTFRTINFRADMNLLLMQF